jgi:rhodanese-related sulfurtransferase
MSRKGIVLLAVLFGAALLLVSLAGRGYRELGDLQSLEKAAAAVRREHPEARPIQGAELAFALGGPDAPLLVDARTDEEFLLSRLPGAIRQTDPKALAELADGVPRLVVYDSVGFRSAKLAEAAARRGDGEIRYLDGGIFRWANEGRPLVDAGGKPTRKVHPYNKLWGRLLEGGDR